MWPTQFHRTAGLALIALGMIFLVNYFLPATWPLVVFGLGAFLLVMAFVWRRPEWMLPGALTLTLGGILFYNALTQDWRSWLYLWPLLFAALGAGMLLQGMRPGPWSPAVEGLNQNRRYVRVAAGFLAAGLVFSAVLGFFQAALNWPVVIWGVGALFLTVALISGLGALIVPASILGGIGLLLAWQASTGNWSSWAYAWALLPAFVGLGLFFGFLRQRITRTVGLWMTLWSLFVFILFGLFFANDGLYARFWPVALILGGLLILFQTALPRRKNRRQGMTEIHINEL